MEIWKDIKWYEWLYQASNLWRVKSLKVRWWNNDGIMSQQLYKNSGHYQYFRLRLSYKWLRKTYWVHRLIAAAFLWFDLSTPMKEAVIMHLDNNPSNNKIENLKIWTQSDNTRQCIKEWRWKQFNRFWEAHPRTKFSTEDILFIRTEISKWVKRVDLASKYWVSKTTIYDIEHRKVWKHI